MLIALRDGDGLRVVAAAGQVSAEVRDTASRRSRGRSAARRCGRGERSASSPASTGLRAPWAKALGAKAELVVPLLFRDRALGVIAAFDGLGDSLGSARRTSGSCWRSRRARPPPWQPANTWWPRARAVASRPPSASGAAGLASCTTRRCRRWARCKLLLAGARRSEDVATLRAALDQGVEQLVRRDRAAAVTDHRPTPRGARPARRRAGARGPRRARGPPVGARRLARAGPRLRGRALADAARTRRRGDRLSHGAGGADQRRQARRGHPSGGRRRARTTTRSRSWSATMGAGFDAGAAETGGGFGLLGMRERVALAGGNLTVAAPRARAPRSGRRYPGAVAACRPGSLKLRRQRPGRPDGGLLEQRVDHRAQVAVGAVLEHVGGCAGAPRIDRERRVVPRAQGRSSAVPGGSGPGSRIPSGSEVEQPARDTMSTGCRAPGDRSQGIGQVGGGGTSRPPSSSSSVVSAARAMGCGSARTTGTIMQGSLALGCGPASSARADVFPSGRRAPFRSVRTTRPRGVGLPDGANAATR